MPVLPFDDDLIGQQRLDQDICDIVSEIESATLKKPSKYEDDGYRFVEGVLYKQSKLTTGLRYVVPLKLQRKLIQHHHSGVCAAHFGPQRVADTLKRTYYWPSLDKTVQDYINGCVTCARRHGQGNRFKPPLMLAELPERPMEKVGMDVLTLPPTVSGHCKVFVLMDYLTKFVWVFPLKNEKAETLGQVLTGQFFPYFGVPEVMLSDRGAAFTGKVFEEISRVYKVKQVFTTAYHPKTDGLVERFNRTLQAALAKSRHMVGGNWKDHLGHVVYAYNSMTHSSTGFPPYLLMFGREPKIPSDVVIEQRPSSVAWAIQPWHDRLPHVLSALWKDARERSVKAQLKQKLHYDKHRDKSEKLNAGDSVWLLRPEVLTGEWRKLALPFYGPFRVEKISVTGVATIRELGNDKAEEMTVNLDRLTRCEPAVLENNLQELRQEQKDSRGRVRVCYVLGTSQLDHVLGLDQRKDPAALRICHEVRLVRPATKAGDSFQWSQDEGRENNNKWLKKLGDNRSYIQLSKPMDFSQLRCIAKLEKKIQYESDSAFDSESDCDDDAGDAGGTLTGAVKQTMPLGIAGLLPKSEQCTETCDGRRSRRASV